MKINVNYILLFLLVGTGNFAYGQGSFPCANEITTNPLIPYSLSNNPQIESGLVSPVFLNTWDWTQMNELIGELQRVPISGINGIYGAELDYTMPHPFDQTNIDYNLGLSSFEYDDLDFWPEDGWELLHMNTGYFPNGGLLTDYGEAVPDTEIPYIMFYDKTTGMIRLFYSAFSLLGDASAINVTLGFMDTGTEDPKVSGLFRSISEYDNALDKATDYLSISMLNNTFHSSNLQWQKAEFFVGYDPCTCIFQSDIKVHFQFFYNYLAQELVNESNIPLLFSHFNFSQNENSSGSVNYKTFSSLLQHYIEVLEGDMEGNENVEKKWREITTLKLFDLINDNIEIADDKFPVTGELADHVMKYYPEVISSLNNGISVNSLMVENDALVILANLNSKLSVKLERNEVLKSPPTPSAMTSDDRATITNIPLADVHHSFVLFNPGTYGNVSGLDDGTGLRYPYYNEVLGLFSLLKSPEIVSYKSPKFDTNENGQKSVSWNQQFKLREPLKFVVNPAAGIDQETTTISASLQWEEERGAEDMELFYEQGGLLLSDNLSSVVDFNVNNRNCENDFLNFSALQNHPLHFKTPFVPLDVFNDLVVENEFQVSLADTISDNYVNTLNFSDLNQSIDLKVKNLVLKLKIDFHFLNSGHQGDTVVTTQVLSYNITQNQLFYPQNPFEIPFDLTLYPRNLTFGESTFGASNRDQFVMEGNTFVITAFDHISLFGDIHVEDGFAVRFVAGNSVALFDGVILDGVVEIVDGDTWEDIWTMTPTPALTGMDVKNYCTGSASWATYRANELSGDENVIDQSSVEEDIDLSIQVYPNPTTDFLMVSVNNKNVVVQQVKVYNLIGELVKNLEVKPYSNSNGIAINTRGFDAGLYLLKVVVDGKYFVKKFQKN